MSNLNIRTLTKSDWKTYRELRLLSLQDSPDSFGSTHEQEAKFSSEEWVARLDSNRREQHVLPLVAELNGNLIGLAWGLIHNPEEQIAHIYQMWVSSTERGQGVGKRLLDQIISWAYTNNLNSVSLAVTTSNIKAFNLYKSMGFQPYGELEALREGSQLFTQSMKSELCSNAV